MNYTEEILNSFNDINMNYMNYNMSVIHLNIRSLRKNFLPFLTNISKIINKIQLIVLTETNICDDENQYYFIDGFNAIFRNRESRGGGIAVYIRKDTQFEEKTIEMESTEAMQITITTTNNKKTTVIPIYRPPNKNIRTFLIELEKLISAIDRQYNIIFLGDINIDLMKQTITTTNYMNILLSYGLHNMINKITREDNKSSTCIDHIFCRWDKNLLHAHAAVIKIDLSDHFAILGCVNENEFNSNKKRNTETAKTSLNNYKVSNDIKNID